MVNMLARGYILKAKSLNSLYSTMSLFSSIIIDLAYQLKLVDM